jgi:hypothetical protein
MFDMGDAIERRPKTVVIVAVVLFAAAAMAAVVGIDLLFSSRFLGRLWRLNPSGAAAFRALGRVAALPLLVLSAGALAAALGLLRRKPWAWWFAVALFTVNGLGNIVGFFATHDALRSISGFAISMSFLYCLTRARVRGYFSADA